MDIQRRLENMITEINRAKSDRQAVKDLLYTEVEKVQTQLSAIRNAVYRAESDYIEFQNDWKRWLHESVRLAEILTLKLKDMANHL